MRQTLGRFGELARPIPLKPADIVLDGRLVDLGDIIALTFQPSAKQIAGSQTTLDTAWGIALLVQGSCEVVQIGAQRTASQPGDDRGVHEAVLDHRLLLFQPG